MLIGCLSAMLSFGTCNGNRGGFTVCAVKNNLGILVVVFIPKRTRFELPFICCGGHFRKQMYSICMCFQDYYYAGYVACCVSVYTISYCLPTGSQAHYVWVRASEVIWSQHTRIISVLSDAI